MEMDKEMRDQDLQAKQKGKEYTDKRRHAKPSEIEVGDTVWLKKMVRPNKLAPMFEPVRHTVVEKKGAELVVENPESNARYRRNVSHALIAVSRMGHRNLFEFCAHLSLTFSFFILLFTAAQRNNR